MTLEHETFNGLIVNIRNEWHNNVTKLQFNNDMLTKVMDSTGLEINAILKNQV